MYYHFEIFRENTGYSAKCCELDGCRSEGDTLEKLKKNCAEALNLYLEEPVDSKVVFPLPDKKLDKDKDLLRVQVEPEIAFALILKYHRIKSGKTQKQISESIGMKNLYSYQRLEKKGNPSLKTINKIYTIFPDIELGCILR